MLQSKNICLVAAFNHEHIFIDPTPKAEESFYERERLFKMPNSSWAHYNPDLISQGGGVFSRSIGHIPLNKHIRHLLGIPPSYDTIPPHELIQFILKAPVDLLWFGGIGTYIKATTESHHQVNDRHNDLLRVDADHVDARVIVEGANLGMTQQARIEFAKKQGRINTDAIDNSAGVSCSDHEVNIKILCQNLIEQGKITREQRNELLAQMAIEVSELVLSDNMKQNMALGLMEYASVQDLSIYQALIQNLEKAETLPLKRKGEFIPTDEELNERRVKNKGLTRPELATIMAYTKINLYQNLLDTFQKKDHYFPQKRNYLRCYFPQTLKNKYAEAIDTHPLKNEIIATVLANNVINRLGAPYVLEMCQATSSNVVDVIEAYADLDELFNLKNIWSSWKKDEKKEEAAIYYQGLYEFIQGIKQLTLVALRNKNIIKNNWVSLNALLPQIMDIFMTYQREYLALSPTKQPLFMEIGPFSPLILEFTCHIKENAQVDEINEAFKVFWDLHTTLNLQLIYDLAQKIPCTEEWQRQAKFTLLDELVQIESKLAHRMLAIGGVHTWYANNKDALQKHNTTLTWVQGALANPYEKVDIALVLHALRSLNLLYEGMKNDNK
jgi:glutamate dehydrogenase